MNRKCISTIAFVVAIISTALSLSAQIGGPEIQVNTYTQGDQGGPQIVKLSNNNVVVVWTSNGQDGSGYGVFGQIFDSQGNKLVNEFFVNTYTINAQSAPQIIAISQGFIVIWESTDQDGSGIGIYGQVFDSLGNKLGNELRINTYTENSQDKPQINSLQQGFVVVWTSYGQDGSSSGIYYQLFDSHGNKFGIERRANTYTTSIQYNPKIAAFSQGFIMVWISYGQDGNFHGIYGQRFDAQGNKSGSEFKINTSNGLYHSPQIFSLSNGFVVAWAAYGSYAYDRYRNDYTIYGQIFDSNGDKLGNEFNIGETPIIENSSIVRIASNVVRAQVYIHGELRGYIPLTLKFNYGIYEVRVTDQQYGDFIGTTNVNQPDITVPGALSRYGINVYSSSINYAPQISALPQGFVIAWAAYEQDGSGYGVYGQIFDNQGNKVGNEFSLNTNTNSNQCNPRILALSQGFLIVWMSDGQDGSGYGIYGQVFDHNGQKIGNEFRINEYTNDSQSDPVMLSTPDGDIIAWNSIGQDGSGSGIYLRYFYSKIISCTQKDNLGNIATEGSWIISPSVDTNASAIDNFTGNPVQVNDPTWQHSINGGAWVGGNTTTIYDEGETQVAFKVQDLDGYWLENQTTVRIDRTLPVISLTADTGWTNQSVTVSATGTDALSGLGTNLLEYKIGPYGIWQIGDSAVVDNAIYSGEIPVTFRISDVAGNVQTASATVRIDAAPPVISVSEEKLGSIVRLTATAADAESGVNPATFRYSIDGGVFVSGSSVAIEAPGSHTVLFRVDDYTGNVGQTEVQVQADSAPPVITATGTAWTNAAIGIARATATDDGAGATGVDAAAWAYQIGSTAGTWIPLTPAGGAVEVQVSAEGETVVYFRVADLAGNEAVASAAVRLDRTPPVFEAWGFETGFGNEMLWFSGFPAISETASGVAWELLSYSIDDGSWMPYVQVIDVSQFEEGTHSLTIRVADYAGNIAISDAKTFVVDRTPPEIMSVEVLSGGVVVPSGSYSGTNTVEVRVNATDTAGAGTAGAIASYSYLLSDSPEESPVLGLSVPAGAPFSIGGLADGMHYLYVQALDAAGNAGGAIASVIIRIDTTPPGAPVITSLSHPRAVIPQDAVALADCIFIVKPTSGGDSGVAGYSYELKAGLNPDTATAISSGDDQDGRI